MGGPMYFLYEMCIGIAWLMQDRSQDKKTDISST
jgi:Sec-independent protein secretion pathway component TatC